MANLLMERGIIGTYHGRDVELVERADYDVREGIDYEKIYGLIEEDSELVLLVFQGRWIGTMTKEGKVTEFKNTKKYSKGKGKNKDKNKEKKIIVEKNNNKKEVIVVPTVDDLLRMAVEDKLYEEVMFR